jgi:UDP-3-O-[3-hydroxymyristoyl] glucosamine N-acyltransferase
MTKTAQEIAKLIGGTVIGNGSIVIKGVTNIINPREGFITFIDNESYLKDVEASSIACIIAPLSVTASSKTLITVAQPKLAFAQLLKVFFPRPIFKKTVSHKATISGKAMLGKDVTIEDFVIVEDGAKIGNNAVLRAGCFIGANVVIGDNTIIHPHVMIYNDCVLGKDVIIHANVVIGCDGFGYVNTGVEQVKVPQVGNVIIEDNVEIGACTTIDRATMGSTIIRKGVKLDNLVQVAHNVEIGENTCASAFVGISGSTKIGKNCTIAGQVGFADHCQIGDNVIIGAQAGIPSKKKIPDNQIFLGSPARPIDQMKKQFGAIALLPRLIEKVAKLEKEIEELKK